MTYFIILKILLIAAMKTCIKDTIRQTQVAERKRHPCSPDLTNRKTCSNPSPTPPCSRNVKGSLFQLAVISLSLYFNTALLGGGVKGKDGGSHFGIQDHVTNLQRTRILYFQFLVGGIRV